MSRELGLDDGELLSSLERLYQLDLVAYAPFRPGAADGFHQVMSLPPDGPGDLLPKSVLPIDHLVAKVGG
jgi:hypothetical protein